MGIFKTYDIRGIYGSEIDEGLAWRIGRALARKLRPRTVLLGHDARQHSPSMYRAFASGLTEEGARATGIGLASTPQLHYTQVMHRFDAGVMVTASHNPPAYHGCKVFDSSGGSVSYDKGLAGVERLLDGIPAAESLVDRPLPSIESIDEYVDFVIAKAAAGSPPSARAVIDVSNGSAGRVFTTLVRRLGIDAEVMNAAPDGAFPNHDPNPLKPESRRQVAAAVLKRTADFGVVLDGDGDRILFVDERGQGIENYFLACLIAEELLAAAPGSPIVYDLISSRVLPERVAEAGGRPVVSRVGYTFIYDRMVETGAIFGAETSGHVYFKVTDTYYTESAAFAFVILARLLARRRVPLSRLIEPLASRYSQSPEVNLEVKDKEAALERVVAAFPGAKVDRLDGVSIAVDEFWFNLRPSNTEPLLRLRLEARSPAVAGARTSEIRRLLEGA